jgi:hypothetical protein
MSAAHSSMSACATARAHLPPKYPSCRGVTQDFAKSFSGQHGQPKYLSKRTVDIGKPTKGLNGMSLTILGMRHSCRRPKRSAHGPRNRGSLRISDMTLMTLMSAFDPKRTSHNRRINFHATRLTRARNKRCNRRVGGWHTTAPQGEEITLFVVR